MTKIDKDEIEILMAMVKGLCSDIGLSFSYCEPPDFKFIVWHDEGGRFEVDSIDTFRALVRGMSIGAMASSKTTLAAVKNDILDIIKNG